MRLTEIGIVVLTALGWVVLLYTLLSVPVSAGSQGIFYTAGLVALAGTTSLLLEVVGWRRRSASGANDGAVRFLGTGMRFALAIEFALWLQSLRMLTIPYLALIVAGFAFVEFLFYQAQGTTPPADPQNGPGGRTDRSVHRSARRSE